MKATTTKINLTKALDRITTLAGSNSISTHAGVVIIIGDPFNGLTLQRTTLDFTIATTVEAEVDEPFRVAVDFARLNTLINKVTADEVDFKVGGDDHILIWSGNNKTRLTRYLDAQLPRDPEEIEAMNVIEITTAELEHSIRTCEPAMYNGPERPALRGICLITAGGYLQFVAADGRRLQLRRLCASKTPTNEDSSGRERGLIFTHDVVAAIKKTFFGDPGPVFIQADEGRIKVSTATSSMICGQLSDPYVNFAPFIIGGGSNAIHCERKHLLEILGRLSATENEFKKVTFEITVGGVDLSSQDEKGSSSCEALECETELDAMVVSFSREYLTDLVKMTSGEMVSIEIHDKIKAVVRGEHIYGLLMGFVS